MCVHMYSQSIAVKDIFFISSFNEILKIVSKNIENKWTKRGYLPHSPSTNTQNKAWKALRPINLVPKLFTILLRLSQTMNFQ